MPYTISSVGSESKVSANNPRYTIVRTEEGEEEKDQLGKVRKELQVAKALPYLNPAYALGAMGTELLSAATKPGAKLESIQELEDARDRGILSNEQFEKAKKAIESQELSTVPSPTQLPYYLTEQATGIPFEPKTANERSLAFGSEMTALSPGGMLSKALTGLGSAEISKGLQELGLPESWSNLIGGFLGVGANVAGGKQPSISQPKPPSGPTAEYTGAATRPEELTTKALVPTEQIVEPKPTFDVFQKVKEFIPELKEPSTEVRNVPGEVEPVKYEKPALEEIENIPEVKEHDPLALNQEVGKIFTNKAELPEAKSGNYLVHTISDVSRPIRDNVKENYEMARNMSTHGEAKAPELVEYLFKERERLAQLPQSVLSGPDKALQKMIDDLLSRTFVNFGGEYIYGGLLKKENLQIPIKNDTIYEIIDRINDKMNYDFEHGSPTAIFSPLIQQLQKQIEKATRANPKEYEAVRYANNYYKNHWAEPFLNEKILPFRNRSKNVNFNQLWNRATSDYDTYRALRKVLEEGKTEEGHQMGRLLDRAFVQGKLKPYIENPIEIQTKVIDFNKVMRELENILPEREFKALSARMKKAIADEKYKQSVKKASKKRVAGVTERNEARKEISRKLVAAEKAETARQKEQRQQLITRKEEFLKNRSKKWIEEHAEEIRLSQMDPEQIATEASTISGLRRVGDFLSRYPNGKKIFNEIKIERATNVLYNGKEWATPEQILEVLKDVNKRRYLIESLGDKNVRMIQENSKAMVRLTNLLKRKKELIDKIKEPESWKDKISSWPKMKKAIVEAISDPKRFVKSLVRDYFKEGISNEDVLKQNVEMNDAINEIEKQIKDMY